MGAQISGFYENMCGDEEPEDVKEADDEAAELDKKKRLMAYFVSLAESAEGRVNSKDFDPKEFADQHGKMLYIFYLKMFTIQYKEKKTSWIHEGITDAKTDEKKQSKIDTSFDHTKSDPFEEIYKKYDQLTKPEKRSYLEEIWDRLLGNTDDANPQNLESEEEKALHQKRKEVVITSHKHLTQWERKVYLLKFCMSVDHDLGEMAEIKEIDLAKVYKESNATLEDMMASNGKKGCIVM